MAKAIKTISKTGGGGPISAGGPPKGYLEFSFTQKERDGVVKYCVLQEDIKKRFRKLTAVGVEIAVVFEKPEAEEMMASLSQAAIKISEDENLKKMFDDLHNRFKLKYNRIFPYK